MTYTIDLQELTIEISSEENNEIVLHPTSLTELGFDKDLLYDDDVEANKEVITEFLEKVDVPNKNYLIPFLDENDQIVFK